MFVKPFFAELFCLQRFDLHERFLAAGARNVKFFLRFHATFHSKYCFENGNDDGLIFVAVPGGISPSSGVRLIVT